MRKYVAETIGTFAMVFCGTGAIIINQETGGTITHVGVSVTFGLIVMAMIYALGGISGAHLNPAVSIAFAIAKRFPLKQLVPYIISQSTGALLASIILKYLFPANQILGTTMPHGSDMQSFILELLLSFFLMLVIINVATGSKEQGMFAGLAIGSTVLLEAMFAGPISGASMNPARSLGPAIVSGTQRIYGFILLLPPLEPSQQFRFGNIYQIIQSNNKMRIALFSDIHANLPALEACFKSMEEQKPDAIYCLGDLVGYNIWPNEVVNEIRKRGIPTISGNYDQGIGLMSDECGCAYKTEPEKDMGKISISYTNSLVQPDERKYLRTLPSHIKVEFQLNNDKFNLLLVHGSPRKINEYLFEDREEKSLLRIMEQADADVMCFGHTHKPYHRTLPTVPGDNTHYRHAINIGSVGKPKDNSPKGCYAIITINADSSTTNKNAVQVEFVRFDYNVEKAAKAVEDSPLPNAFADMLRKGY